MKFFLFGLVLSISSSSYAVKSCTATIPQDCEIQNTEFHAANSTTYSLAVDCLTPTGDYIKYIGTTGTLGTLFDMGRFYMPETIYFKRANQSKVDLQCR